MIQETHNTVSKVLHLTLKKKWFDMIASGEKREEYRELKGYWATRLLYKIPMPTGGYLCAWRDIADGNLEFQNWKNGTGNAPVFQAFDRVHFRNGYSSKAPEITFICNGIGIGEGNQLWGAQADNKYFVIKLGEKIS